MKPKCQFFLIVTCAPSQKLKSSERKSDPYLSTIADQHPEFYFQQLVLIILETKSLSQQDRKKKSMWANFLSRKLSQCAMKQIFKRLTF